MAAAQPYDSHLDPSEFSPSPRLVKGAVALLVVAALAGLWKGINADLFVDPNPVPSATASGPVAAAMLPAVGATPDTLIPPQALVETGPAPGPPVRARAAVVEPAPVEVAAEVEAAPQVVLTAPDPAPEPPAEVEEPEPTPAPVGDEPPSADPQAPDA